jgi:L-threonylcarbamoyladenylate synthase
LVSLSLHYALPILGIESTVLDLTATVPTILRPGMVTADDLRALLGRVESAPQAGRGYAARPSPGMMDRHYSPAAQLRLSAPGADAVVDLALQEQARGANVLVLARAPVAEDSFAVWQMPASPAEYARILYSMLHRADAAGYTVIVVESVPASDAWAGVRDRLTRAAR